MRNDKSKWFKRLEKILNAMPESVELYVESSSYETVTIRMMLKGVIRELEKTNNHDRAVVAPKIEEVEFGSFTASSVIANSENV